MLQEVTDSEGCLASDTIIAPEDTTQICVLWLGDLESTRKLTLCSYPSLAVVLVTMISS